MSRNPYFIGQLVRVKGVFKDSTLQVVDPGVVKCKVEKPDGSISVLTYGVDVGLVRESTGTYYYDVNVDTNGTWHYRFESSGTGQAANESAFYVEEGNFQ